MPTLSLKQMSDRLSTMTEEEIVRDGNALLFSNEIADLGADVLREISSDELLSAISLIQSMALVTMLNMDEINTNDLKFLLSDKCSKMVALTLRMSVGLAVSEEWR